MSINLGKITTILVALFIPYLLVANVKLTAPSSFYSGDDVVFQIKAEGSNVELPNIKDIDGFVVQNAGTSTQTSIINGIRTQSKSKKYAFKPTKDVVIPPIEVKIDGKIYKTKQQNIKKLKVNKTNSPYYDLTISIDKTDVYLAQELRFKLKFKYRKDLQIVDLNFEKPIFENFWVKELQTNQKQKQVGDYVEQDINYVLFPQKSGELKIEPLRIDVVVLDNRAQNPYSFFAQQNTKTIPVYSNEINLNVKELPKGVDLIGDFKISATIDKNSVNQGDGVSYKLEIKGFGNIDDIKEYKLDIPDVTIYENRSKKEYKITNGKYGGTFSKTYSIVSQNDFTIPSIKLNYFNNDTKKVETIKTKEYKIKVNGVKKEKNKLQVKDTNHLETKKVIETTAEKTKIKVIETTDNQKIVFFFIGLVVGIVIILLYILFKNKKINQTKETPLLKQIKQTKTTNELLKILSVYIKFDKQLDKIIYSLEINNDIDFKKIKKEVLKIIKDKKLDT
ncbi:MAG: BatD family protein [Campylobacterota bacterium]|nr:BatD family protein [Campylobacterota bacterium]